MPKEIGGEIFYTLDEIEELLAMSPTTVRELIDQDKLIAKKIDDELLISNADLNEYLEARARQT